MSDRKETHGAKMTRKAPHVGTRRAATARTNKTKPVKSVYSEINGNFRVLFPTETTTDKRVLAFAVSSVVAKMKN